MLSVNSSNNAMTIPSRPAPPPPKPTNNMRQHSNHNGQQSKSISRYTPTTDWDDKPFDSNDIDSAFMLNKKIPPPRPPPPKGNHHQPNSGGTAPVLKKSATPNSVNILSNLFGVKPSVKRSKTPPNRIGGLNQINKIPPKVPPPPSFSFSAASHTTKSTSNTNTASMQLIDFNSPPSSPTLTQKSNSDCVSVDSFSSDSIYSPNNGNTSQAESGFEDDFNVVDVLHIKNKDPWEPLDPFEMPGETTARRIPILPPAPSSSTVLTTKSKPIDFVDPLCNGKSLITPTVVAAPTIIRPVGAAKKRENYALLPQVTETLLKDDSYEDAAPPSPPMPLMPPPPPPPEFFDDNFQSPFVNNCDSETVNMSDKSYGISLYDFESTQPNDLDFKANEKIYLIQKINDEWYYGRNRRGCEGMFPINYLDIKIPLSNNDSNPCSLTAASSIGRSLSMTGATQSTAVRVMYTFNGEVAGDLRLMEGDMVEIQYEINSEWLYGRIGAREGQFPANFVECIPKNLPKMP